MKPRGVMVTLTVIILTVSTFPVASTTDTAQYSMAVDGSIDVPDRTVTFEGSEYEISAIAQADVGASLSVDVTAPAEPYSVIIYNSDRMFADNKESKGSDSFEFDLTGYEPGTYMIAIDSGQFEVMHPLVVRGYAVTMDTPSSVEATTGDELDVSVTATQVEDEKTLDKVQIVLGNENDDLRVDASKTGDGTYRATVQTDELGTGEYMMYAVVRGNEEAFGTAELLGVSETTTVTVSKPSQETPQSTDEGDPSNDVDTPARSPEETTTEPTRTEPPTTEPSMTESTTTVETTDEPIPTPTTTTTEQAVITPEFTSETTTETSGQPGFGFLAVIIAFVGSIAIGRHRYL